MKLEEAEIFLMKIAQEYKTYGDLDNPEFEDIKKIPEAVETVLQESDKLKHDNYKLDKENQELFEKNINSIPKKKIEELIENESINISGFECISVEDIQELLEDK